MRKKIRVVQFGVGPIGASIAKLLRQKQGIELSGAVDSDPEKAGRDLGEVVGAEDAPWGVTVRGDTNELLEHPADVVVHSTGSRLESVAEQLLECLRAGCCVVSTCEELAYPFRKYPELAAQIDEAAKEEGVAIVGTGVNPGYALDKLLLTLAASAQRVDFARGVRIVDAGKRRLPLQQKIGAGLSVEEFRQKVAEGVLKHHGLPESVGMVGEGLGFELDDIYETIEPVIAERTVCSEFLEVAAGSVAGVHQVAQGFVHGSERVRLELQMFIGASEPADTILLGGEPNLGLTIPGGVPGDSGTAAIVVNAIPNILAAPAGLRTVRDLPLGYLAPGARL